MAGHSVYSGTHDDGKIGPAAGRLTAWGKIAQKIRVPAGTVLGVIFLFLMHPSTRSLWIGGVVTLAGAALRVWAAGHIEKGRVLAKAGPYGWSRNPLYLGSLFMALGILLAGQGYLMLLPFGIFFVGLYYPVMKREEQELLDGYGEDFLEYARRVPFFFPSTFSRSSGPSTFRWSRVLQNREHRTLLGLALIELFLILKSVA